MLQLETMQNVEAEQLKQAFCKVMATEAKSVPPSPTLRQVSNIEIIIPHLLEVATTYQAWLEDDFII